MPDKSDLSHLLLRKLRELSLHERTFSMVPSDKRIEIAGHTANEIEICFAQLVVDGLLDEGSAVDDDGNLVFTGLSTTGRDFVGPFAIRRFPSSDAGSQTNGSTSRYRVKDRYLRAVLIAFPATQPKTPTSRPSGGASHGAQGSSRPASTADILPHVSDSRSLSALNPPEP
jgi:hypothetical protein